jgi:rRNA-processing protein FCF1
MRILHLKHAGKNLPLKVIIDSNFLFIPFQFSIDIFEELAKVLNRRFVPILLSPTCRELLTMAQKGSPKTRKQASFALELAKKCCKIQAEQSCKEIPDDVILRKAKEWLCPVATNDMDLRKRLRKEGLSTIFLRGKKQLSIDGLF